MITYKFQFLYMIVSEYSHTLNLTFNYVIDLLVFFKDCFWLRVFYKVFEEVRTAICILWVAKKSETVATEWELMIATDDEIV